MSDFVFDNTSVPDGKVDANPLGVPANKGVTATEWNSVCQDLKDLRNAITNGKFHSLQDFAASLSAVSKGTIRYNNGRVQISENAGAYRTSLHPDVNVLDFGADPTGVADSAPAFMAAIASFGPSTGATASDAGTVIVPPGTYRLASTVRVKKSVWIKGSHAAGGCTIKPDPGLAAFKFERYNTSTDLGTGAADLARISNLQITNSAHKVGVWLKSHAYIVGDRKKVGPAPGQGAIPFTDPNEFYRHYECTTAGTSAGSGTGPKSFGNDQTLTYKTQTVNFTVGDFVTGGTSGAFGKIIQDTDGGATGTLRLTSWNGIAFQNNEALTDDHTGAAVANGTNAAASDDEHDGTAKWKYIGSGAGLHIRANGVVCQDMVIVRMSGAGVHIVGGDLENPGAFANANGWQFYAGSVVVCDGPAFYIRGSDTNGGLCVGTSIGGCGGPSSDGDFSGPDYNIRDCSFLGCTYIGCEIYAVGGQGAVFTNSIGGGFCAIGCYLEGTGGGPSVSLNQAMIFGGGLSVADWRGSAGPTWLFGAAVVFGPASSYGVRSKIAGFSANTWRNNSFIPVGISRVNGSNVYVCTTAGTTAVSPATGPSGTGTGIADGSCVWDFVSVGCNDGNVTHGSPDPALRVVSSSQAPQEVGTGLAHYDRYVSDSGFSTNVRVEQYGISGPSPSVFDGNGLGHETAINKTILTETPQKIPAGKEMRDMMWLGGVRIMGTDTAADPAAGTFSKGDLIFYKRTPVTAGGALGRRCTVDGTAGTYSGGRTATASGSTTVVVSGAAMSALVDQQDFRVGDKLTINGVTSRVQSVSADGRTLVMGSSVTTGSGLAITFSHPVWEEFGTAAAPALAAVGSSPSANGASLSGQTLTLQPADATHPGLLTILAQTIAGAKTFSSTIASSVASAAMVLSADAGNWGLKFVTDKMQFFVDGSSLFEVDASGAGQINAAYNLAPMNNGAKTLGVSGKLWLAALLRQLQDANSNTRVDVTAAQRNEYVSDETDGASAVAHRFANRSSLANAGAKVASFFKDNFSTEVASITKDGQGRFSGGLGVGNSATATVAVGTLAKKIEVFDASGTSLGFVPVYSSIA